MNAARVCGLAILGLALILPSWGQDAKTDKKPADKAVTDKKVPDKKIPDKKITVADKNKKKDSSKLNSKSKTRKKAKKQEINPEDKVVYGQVVTGQLKQIDANSQRDFTVTLMLPDPKKIFDLNLWMNQQILGQQNSLINVARQTNPINRANAMASYQQSVLQYNIQLAQRETQIYSPKDFDLRAAEKIKVRTAAPPPEYDDKGNMKRWTLKELKHLKKGSKLPGYPAQFDALRPGQLLAVYLAKPALPEAKTTKKGIKLEPAKVDREAAAANWRPEVVMVIVIQDPLPGQR